MFPALSWAYQSSMISAALYCEGGKPILEARSDLYLWLEITTSRAGGGWRLPHLVGCRKLSVNRVSSLSGRRTTRCHAWGRKKGLDIDASVHGDRSGCRFGPASR
jgi:hypothetical protein